MIIKHILDHTIHLLMIISIVPPLHLEQITVSFPWPRRPHMSCPLTASFISSMPESLLLTCSMPSSFPPQDLCICFSQLRTFLLHSFLWLATVHSSELCSAVMSSGRPSLTILDKAALLPWVTLTASSKHLSLSDITLFILFLLVHCLAPQSRMQWIQRVGLSTAECPVASTEPDMQGPINIWWINEWIEYMNDMTVPSLISWLRSECSVEFGQETGQASCCPSSHP